MSCIVTVTPDVGCMGVQCVEVGAGEGVDVGVQDGCAVWAGACV